MSFYVTAIFGAILACSLAFAQEPTCGKDSFYYKEEDICIGRGDTSLPAMYAKYACRRSGGNVLNKNSPAIRKFINQNFKGEVENYWINLKQVEGMGYVWLPNNEKPTATFWAEGEPNKANDCTFLNVNTLKWSTADCKNRKLVPLCAITPFVQDKRCPKGYWFYKDGNTCMLVIKEYMTFVDARSRCQKLGNDLVKVPDTKTKQFIRQTLTAGSATKWIGVRRRPGTDDYRWVVDNSTFTLGKDVWLAKPLSMDDCALVAMTDPKLMATGCNSYRSNPICEVKAKSCQEGWTGKDAMCFKVFGGKKTNWQQARDNCKAAGGDLAAIPNAEVLETIKGIMGPERYWIGLNDKFRDGKFRWLDETEEITFTAWNNKPRNILGNEYCAELIGKKEGRWNDKPCQVRRYSICQKEV